MRRLGGEVRVYFYIPFKRNCLMSLFISSDVLDGKKDKVADAVEFDVRF